MDKIEEEWSELVEKYPHLLAKNRIAEKITLAHQIKETEDPFVFLEETSNLKIRIYQETKETLGLPEGVGYIRESVAKALSQVSEALPKSYQLVIWDTYRSVKVQTQKFQKCLETYFIDYPYEEAYWKASVFIAPPDIAPHCTGGAVDLTLAKNGNELDMGSFYIQRDAFSETANPNIPLAAKSNKLLLAKKMLEAGFVNYPNEWWHWSVGDRYFGVVKGIPATYGIKDLEVKK